jgi:hypothetical protein
MNCQEFRNTWMLDTDDAALSHVETCEECLAWVEANFTSDEEVSFLKESPQPSVQLEDRIMQAIYQTAGHGVVPQLTAAKHSVSAAPRRWTRATGLAWASAAGILLAVGLVGYQNLMVKDHPSANQQAAMESTGTNTKASEAEAPEPQAPVASPPADSGSALASIQSAPESATPTPKADAKLSPRGDAAPSPALLAPPTPASPQHRPMIAARNNQTKPSAAESPQPQPSNEKVVMSDTETANQPTALQPAPPVNGITSTDQQADRITALSKQPDSELVVGKAPIVGPPREALVKPEITLSSFTEVETAVQASDMPVPTAGKLPSNFALHSIHLQYESETSKHVTQTTVEYRRGADLIKVEVFRNTDGKRSLSIPGTFIDTQLFQIDGEQAIAVSYDPQAPSADPSVQHAVHFNTQKENQSLYVVLSANGIRLHELIEVAKELNWK